MLCARQAVGFAIARRALPKLRAPTALGRACARRYGRHLGRGSPPQRPASRFHDFAPCEPNWLVAAPQSDSDSLTFSPQAIRSPARSAEQTEVKKGRPSPDIRWRFIARSNRLRTNSNRDACRSLQFPPPWSIERSEAAPSQRAARDSSRLDAGFSQVW